MIPDAIKDKKLLLDLDVVRYRVCWAAHPEGAEDAGLDHVREYLAVTMRSITRSSGERPCSFEGWLSGDTSFRESISKTQPYKGNRKDRVKPRYFKETGEILTDEYGAKWTEGGLEADDQLAICLTADPKGSCVVGIDKDLLQVPGWHHNWVKGGVKWVSRKAGDFSLYSQILSGDTTDHIPGIKGIGPGTAAKILAGSESRAELCQRAWDAYRNHGYSRGYFLEQAELIYLLRREGDSFSPPIELKEDEDKDNPNRSTT